MPVAVSGSVSTRPAADALARGYRGVVGEAPAMRALFATLVRLERSIAPVLIEGESGVGKELVSRALHDGSPRAAGPMIVLNCGALPRELLTSELFGHRRGAFTGAHDSRKGAFESADGGTLFLDEIGELPLDLQPMLLRALESGEIRAVGDDAVQHVDVRLIAATNRDLAGEVARGRFREDLFYRLAVVRLQVPALRDRAGDIPLLAAQFARGAGLPELPTTVVDRLCRRRWDGNVRELRNAVLAFAALGVLPEPAAPRRDQLAEALRAVVDPNRSYAEQKDALVDQFTAVWLVALLDATDGNQTEAARRAGLDRGYLGRLIARHGLGRRTR